MQSMTYALHVRMRERERERERERLGERERIVNNYWQVKVIYKQLNIYKH